MINDHLKYAQRSLRTLPGKLLLGPTGKRLCVDYLDKEPGFCGRIDFIHKVNLTSLFRITCSAHKDFSAAETVWYPSMLTMALNTNRIEFAETKFITWDDCGVSCQRWKNKMGVPITLDLEVQASLCVSQVDEASGCKTLTTPPTTHGYRVGVAVATNVGLEKAPLTLKPGESIDFVVVAATGNLETESLASLGQKATGFFSPGTDYIDRHNREYQDFFAKTPSFYSSDPVLNKAWHYRWFVLRHNLAQPDYGYLQGPLMYEGRSHKKSKTPLKGGGWEFAKLINLSTPLHLTDMRWHVNKTYVSEMIRAMVATREENGLFCSAYVDRRMHSFANYGVWAIYQVWLVDGNDDLIKDILPQLKEVVSSETKVYSKDDQLQIEIKHNRTGKEYQPSYWYFHNYPQNPKDPATYTPLKRVDRSCYHYLNVLGLANLCQALGDGDQDFYARQAEEIKRDILAKMWDQESGFFYDLHHETDAKALVKNIVGIYPYWAGIAPAGTETGLEKLFDPKYFNTNSPFPSVARDCPAYRPEGGWMGKFVKGRNGCVWSGPSWPYTTGIALDAIGQASQKNGHLYDGEFGHFLREYSWQHFRDRDLNKPYLVEHYHGETGEPLSDEVDYNHSYYLDLIVKYVAGIQVGPEGVSFDPLDIRLDYYILDKVQIRGRSYKISYKREGCTTPEAANIPQGYRVYCDGKEVSVNGEGS